MKRTAIMTDSNSGITQEQAKELGIHVLPMPFLIDDETYYDGISLTKSEFYERQQNNAKITTSQPSPADLTEFWDKLLQEYDEILHIPMSSGLSNSCATAQALALDEDYEGKVIVVDNQRISVTQRQSVLDARGMADKGYDAETIRKILEETKLESSIYVTVDTLTYLKKGGRITPAVAAIGTILRIKPILQIQGDKLDTFSKARTYKIAKQTMLDAVKKDIETRFGGDSTPDNVVLCIVHANDPEAAEEYRKEVLEAFPGHEIYIDDLSLSVSCHIGPGALALTVSKKLKY
ncbi:MAG: DegV family protein [Lachnospiraceae bacterium]|nr:DegV family protein [Lachnospiraceae bacterium]